MERSIKMEAGICTGGLFCDAYDMVSGRGTRDGCVHGRGGVGRGMALAIVKNRGIGGE